MCYLDFSKIEITEKLVFDLFKNKKSNLNNKNAINVWTILDVKKRNHANLNKLNFIEIFGCNFTKDFLFD